MNYYIQGDAANADRIKAAFEKLGYSTSLHVFFDEDTVFITLNGNICECSYGGAISELIKTHPDYKELELPVEPKFKVGDWVVTNYGKVSQVVSVDNDGDGYTLDDGVYFSGSWCDMYHLWTIQDAKDGDVLVCYSEVKDNPIGQAGIFKQYVGRLGGCSNTFWAHTGIDWDGNIIINGYMGSTNILPATKEQRNLLFKKMKEAGYEWDVDKKELRKIQLHYDISNFKPFDKVLVRDSCTASWNISLFGCMGNGDFVKKYRCLNAHWVQCIPYEGNEHLLGTTDMCDEEYVNW